LVNAFIFLKSCILLMFNKLLRVLTSNVASDIWFSKASISLPRKFLIGRGYRNILGLNPKVFTETLDEKAPSGMDVYRD
jgi:hypothetical protein